MRREPCKFKFSLCIVVCVRRPGFVQNGSWSFPSRIVYFLISVCGCVCTFLVNLYTIVIRDWSSTFRIDMKLWSFEVIRKNYKIFTEFWWKFQFSRGEMGILLNDLLKIAKNLMKSENRRGASYFFVFKRNARCFEKQTICILGVNHFYC